MNTENIYVVLVTAPSAEAARIIAEHLIRKNVAACVSIVPNVTSHFKWEGKTEVSSETLMIVKTTAQAYSDLESLIVKHHPYDCPEIIALPVQKGLEAYCKWVQEQTK